MTQTEVADLAGVARSSVHTLESGKASMQLDVVVAIADTLGCDLRLFARNGTEVRGV